MCFLARSSTRPIKKPQCASIEAFSLNEVLGDGPAPNPRGGSFEWRKALLCQVRQSHPTLSWWGSSKLCCLTAHVREAHRKIRAFKRPIKKPQCASIEAFSLNEVLGDGPAPNPRGGSFEWRKALLCQVRQSHPTLSWWGSSKLCCLTAHVREAHRKIRAFKRPIKKPQCASIEAFSLNEVLGDDLLSHGETPHYHRR